MLYVGLPVHNRVTITQSVIECIAKQTYENYKLILIDDGSTDGTADMVLSYLPDTVIIRGEGNLWWGGALQKGFEWLKRYASESGFCLILNDDTIFEEDFFAIGISLLERTRKTLFCALCYSQQTNKLLDEGVNFNYKELTFNQANNKNINCLSTRGLFLKYVDWQEIGGFHTIILPHYLSDYEFTIRAYKLGFNLKVNKDLKLSVNETTTGLHKINYTNIRDYYRKYFSKRNTMNPFYFTSFIILTVPSPYKKSHLVKIPVKLLKDIVKPIFMKNT